MTPVECWSPLGSDRVFATVDAAIDWVLSPRQPPLFTPLEVTLEVRRRCVPGDALEVEIPTGAEVVDAIVDRFAEDCTFPELAEEYWAAAQDPDVIAAFDAALDLLVSKQTFIVAAEWLRTETWVVDLDDDGNPTAAHIKEHQP